MIEISNPIAKTLGVWFIRKIVPIKLHKGKTDRNRLGALSANATEVSSSSSV
jgi:hypothetical protein